MTDLFDVIKAQTDAIARAFNAGHDAGYRKGFQEGIAEAQKIIAKVFPEQHQQKKAG